MLSAKSAPTTALLLRKHKDHYGGNTGSSIDKYFPKSGLVPLNWEDKDAITMLSVEFVSRYVRSFETLSGEGLIALAEGLVDIGVRAGTAKLLPDTTTVSRWVSKATEESGLTHSEAEEAADWK